MTLQTCGRHQIDDVSASTLLTELLHRFLRAKERTFDVHFIAEIEIGFLEFMKEFSAAIDAGVINHDVEPPERAHSCGNQSRDLVPLYDIALLVDRLPAPLLDQLCSGERRLLVEARGAGGLLDVAHDNQRALGR